MAGLKGSTFVMTNFQMYSVTFLSISVSYVHTYTRACSCGVLILQ